MKTIKIKIAEATPLQIDYLVAREEGKLEQFAANKASIVCCESDYSTCWTTGGPILERERISTVIDEGDTEWQAVKNACSGSMFGPGLSGEHWSSGPTMLIAGLRCYVASRLGNEAEIPEGLK